MMETGKRSVGEREEGKIRVREENVIKSREK